MGEKICLRRDPRRIPFGSCTFFFLEDIKVSNGSFEKGAKKKGKKKMKDVSNFIQRSRATHSVSVHRIGLGYPHILHHLKEDFDSHRESGRTAQLVS